VRERTARLLAEHGAPSDEIAAVSRIFDPQVLTVGFARRFATYKRPNLLLHDADRLARILLNRERPVQIVVAGKAHPNDGPGQSLIEQWIAFIRRADVRGRVVFLADYDMLVAERLVQGVDVWINTPRRPWEACGTSGMKVLVNGGLNLSELDGWWAEAYAPEVGWAIGDGQDRGDDPAWDETEADAVYALLEGDVASAFYARDGSGLPRGWIARMRESMARLTPAFSATRMARQYLEQYYLPAASAYRARAADGARCGAELVEWDKKLERNWSAVRFVGAEVRSEDGQHLFRVTTELGALDPGEVRVELYADDQRGGEPTRIPMARVDGTSDSATRSVYAGAVPASRPARDFTPRIVSAGVSASVPLEAPFILWYDRV
jgi:starch phosphorylase